MIQMVAKRNLTNICKVLAPDYIPLDATLFSSRQFFTTSVSFGPWILWGSLSKSVQNKKSLKLDYLLNYPVFYTVFRAK